MFTVKKISKDEFYPVYAQWMQKRDFPVWDKILLPDDAFVAYRGEEPICCAWLVLTNSALAWLAFPGSNPLALDRRNALEVVFRHMADYARGIGSAMVFTTSNTPSVQSALLGSGFDVGDTNVQHYIKIL